MPVASGLLCFVVVLRVVFCCLLRVVGCWLFVARCWFLVVGLLAGGCQALVAIC